MRRAIVVAVGAGALLACAQLADGVRRNVAQVGPVDLRGAEQAVKTVRSVYESVSEFIEDLTPENEYWVGRAVAANILHRSDYAYLDKPAIAAGRLEGLTDYVYKVGNLVAAAAMETPGKGDRPPPLAGWHFVVLDSDKVNAYAAPGGYIFVTRGAVKATRTEDELAAVLAHEVAHVVRGHGLGTIKTARVANLSKGALKTAGDAAGRDIGPLVDLLKGSLDDMLQTLFDKGYSQPVELEADRVGKEIARRAGYDPGAMADFLRTVQGLEAGKTEAHLSHSAPADRIRALGGGGAAVKPAGFDARTARFKAATAKLK